MKQTLETPIVYSEDFHSIHSSDFTDWCIHLVCRQGEGRFLYNGKPFLCRKNDVLIILQPDKVSHIEASKDLHVEFIAASNRFLSNQLPNGHYGIAASVMLGNNPVMPVSDADALQLSKDFHLICERLGDTRHSFHKELVGSLILVMVYDLYEFHSKIFGSQVSSQRTIDLVGMLSEMLASGLAKRHRDVAYYASRLNVSPKYLSDTVRRNTGQTVISLINRHTVPIIIDYLRNTSLSISQIADEMGFASLTYFSYYVRKHLGMSPKAYRETKIPKRE